MARISAKVEKKVPIVGMNYSSQTFEAHVEIDVDDEVARDNEQLQAAFARLYGQCLEAVHAQIEAANQSRDTVELVSRWQ